MQIPKILIVDDESAIRTSLHRVLTRKNYQVTTASDFQEALDLGQGVRSLDLAIVDLKLPLK